MKARNTALALLAAALPAACAGGNQDSSALPLTGAPTSARTQRDGWLSPQAKKHSQPLVYVSDYDARAIEIYPAGVDNPAPVGQITQGLDGPLGTFVDKQGTLYVANSLNNTITEYPAGSTSPSVTLSNSINGPISVAVDSKGTVAVGEFSSGEILEFPKGASSPTITIQLSLPEALAYNKNGWLFAAWNVNGGSKLVGHVAKCRPGGYNLCIDQGITEGERGGLAIDKAGDEILGDQTNEQINVYSRKMSLLRTISTAGHTPYKFELDKKEQTLYVADYSNGEVVMYDYSTGEQTGTISSGLESVWGVSLSPPARYGR
jgi:DNA-binding beta-propeller fold protein YncE